MSIFKENLGLSYFGFNFRLRCVQWETGENCGVFGTLSLTKLAMWTLYKAIHKNGDKDICCVLVLHTK